jgi:hypothetical protein
MQERYQSISILCKVIGLLALLTIFIIPVSTADEPNITQNNPVYVITNITLDESDLQASPGISISPSVTLQNIGAEPATDSSVQFRATLGPKNLINGNTVVPAPHAGKPDTYSLSFTLPSIQPGEYFLEIYVSPEKNQGTGSQESSMKTHKTILVTNPLPGSIKNDCGCS